MMGRKGAKLPHGFSQYLADIGSRGGVVSAEKLTPAQRSERARKAALAREMKRKGGGR